MRISKFLNRSALVLMAATMLFPSCSVDDLFKGEEEHVTITDKNSGELKVNEPYADQVCRYDAKGQQDIEAVEFFADGYCMVTYSSYFELPAGYYSPKRTITVHADGKDFKLPSALGRAPKAPEARYDYWNGNGNEPRIYRYTYSNGVYTINEAGWRIENDVLYMHNEYGAQEIALEKTDLLPQHALTSRLCHKWDLQKVLIKMYNGNKLLMSYQMPQSEMEETCVSDLVFSRAGTFLRHDGQVIDGTGYWKWDNRDNQQMSYEFRAPYIGSNSTMVYFSGNNLYMTEELTREEYDDDDYEDDEEIYFDRVVLLYKCVVNGN